jgi:hypothetical protein
MLRRLSSGTWLLLCFSGVTLTILTATQLTGAAPSRFLSPPLAGVVCVVTYRWLRPKWGMNRATPPRYNRVVLAGVGAVLGMSVVGPLVRSLGDGATIAAVGVACGFVVGATAARTAHELLTRQDGG